MFHLNLSEINQTPSRTFSPRNPEYPILNTYFCTTPQHKRTSFNDNVCADRLVFSELTPEGVVITDMTSAEHLIGYSQNGVWFRKLCGFQLVDDSFHFLQKLKFVEFFVF